MNRCTLHCIRTSSLVGALWLAAGCSPNSQQVDPEPAASAVSVERPEPAAPSVATITDDGVAGGPRYPASMAEGISFGSPGYPEFVRTVEGVSGSEGWGRWSDAALAPHVTIRLQDSVEGDFTLTLKARDYFGVNSGSSAIVRIGLVEQSFEITDGAEVEAELSFRNVPPSDSIEIMVPNHSQPSETDSRRMGIGLISLSIVE